MGVGLSIGIPAVIVGGDWGLLEVLGPVLGSWATNIRLVRSLGHVEALAALVSRAVLLYCGMAAFCRPSIDQLFRLSLSSPSAQASAILSNTPMPHLPNPVPTPTAIAPACRILL